MKLLSEILTATCAVGLVVVGLIYSNPYNNYSRDFEASVLVSNGQGYGSGTFITPTKVLTARHVAKYADPNTITPTTMTVEDIKGGVHEVIGVEYPDKMVDAAILIVREPLEEFKPAPVSCRLPAIGEELHNIGNPWGSFKWYWARAWVGAYDSDYKGAKRSPSTRFNGMVLYQGLSIGGQSGSAMFDSRGNVVGILVIGIGSPGRNVDGVDAMGGFVATSYICDWVKGQVEGVDKKAPDVVSS